MYIREHYWAKIGLDSLESKTIQINNNTNQNHQTMKKLAFNLLVIGVVGTTMVSCAAKKELETARAELSEKSETIAGLKLDLKEARTTIGFNNQSIMSLEKQLADCKEQRDKQLTQVGDLTVLSKSANENIGETLAQLRTKDKYIHMLQAARSKADSINLALAVNLKGVLKKGLDDEDITIQVDKTVVMINLSDSMLYKTGQYTLTPRAGEVLGKIAEVVQSRPNLEVMVEGYTDNVPIKTECLSDNWDLSVKRSTSVVRALQDDFNIDPNRLIAAGRGEYNTLAANTSSAGRAINRRTRIILMPKLDEFYDLLDPNKIPEGGEIE